MSTEVRASVRIDLAGNVKQGIDETTKSITAAEQAARKLNDTLKHAPPSPSSPGSPNAPTGTGGAPVYDKRILQAELAARMSSAELERYLAAEEAKRKADQHKRETAARLSQQQQARQTLAMQGLALSGMGGAAGGYGQGLAISSALEGAGMAGLGRLAGPVGLGIGAFAQGVEYRTQLGALALDPRLTQEQRNRQFVGSSTFLRNMTAASDLFSGDNVYNRKFIEMPAAMERQRERNEANSTMVRMQSELRATARDITARQVIAERGLDATREFRIPGVTQFDRSTETGQRKAREDQATLASRTELVKAERNLATASAAYTQNLSSQMKLSKDYEANAKNARNAQAAAAQAAAAGNTVDRLKFQNLAVAYGEENLRINSQFQQYTRDEVQLREAKSQAQRQKAQAEIGVRQANIAVLESREATAAGTAGRIGGMGPGERATGLAALAALNQIGVENAPADLIASAESVAPLRVGRMREEAGSKLAEGDFGNRLRELGAEEDIRDVGRLDSLRKEVDAEKAGVQTATQAADVIHAEDVVAAREALSDLLDFMTTRIPMAINQLEDNLRLGASNK